MFLGVCLPHSGPILWGAGAGAIPSACVAGFSFRSPARRNENQGSCTEHDDGWPHGSPPVAGCGLQLSGALVISHPWAWGRTGQGWCILLIARGRCLYGSALVATCSLLLACFEAPTDPAGDDPDGFPCDSEQRCPGKMACDAATNTCSGGGHVSCMAPLSDCGGTCTFILADDHNCGACSHPCGPDEACINGLCSLENATCAYCAPGVACVNGACSCEGRGDLCSVLCLDTQQLAVSCGGCFEPCAGDQICRSGACTCPPGQKTCNGECTDVTANPAACGDCGRACPDAQLCESGSCVAACTVNTGDACGDNRCWNTLTDRHHCGLSCTACGEGTQCVGGQCLCPGSSTACGARCVNTQQDSLHCGVCDHACQTGQECVAGECICQPGLNNCNATCVSTLDDAAHCGGCGLACGGGQVCLDGTCTASCPPTRESCLGFCLGAAHPEHCGDCDQGCAPGEACVDGSCATMRPAVGCAQCPCDQCDVDRSWLCCMRNAQPVCVDGTRCPA